METKYLDRRRVEEYVGAQIRSLRQDEHLTQKALANRANVSLSSLQSLELGRGSSLTTVVKVMRSLGRSDWFETLAPPQPLVSPREQWRIAEQQSVASETGSLGETVGRSELRVRRRHQGVGLGRAVASSLVTEYELLRLRIRRRVDSKWRRPSPLHLLVEPGV